MYIQYYTIVWGKILSFCQIYPFWGSMNPKKVYFSENVYIYVSNILTIGNLNNSHLPCILEFWANTIFTPAQAKKLFWRTILRKILKINKDFVQKPPPKICIFLFKKILFLQYQYWTNFCSNRLLDPLWFHVQPIPQKNDLSL